MLHKVLDWNLSIIRQQPEMEKRVTDQLLIERQVATYATNITSTS